MIDPNALQRLRQIIGDDPADLIEMIGSFLEEGPMLLRQIAAAMERREELALRQGVHSLKSNARDFGANALADMAQSIEEDLRGAGSSEAMQARVDAIVDEWQRVEAELRRLSEQVGRA